MDKISRKQWVSVKDRLPEEDEIYIVAADDEGEPMDERIWGGRAVVCAEYFGGSWSWQDGKYEYDLTGLVTHWMPLPEPPEEDK